MRILLRHYRSPGDILMLTAAVRDLKRAHPYIKVNVDTSAAPLWDNNPFLSRDVTADNADRVIDIEYPLIDDSDALPYHFIHSFRKELQLQLGLAIPQGPFRPDVYLSENEKNPLPLSRELGDYWIVDAGYKKDFTLKNWGLSRYQEVVDLLRGAVTFVQIGEGNPDHVHRGLNNVIDMIGKTGIRDFMRLVYHSSGVLTPVSFPMHLSAALPLPDGGLRPCVVVAGAREPAHWEQYPGHVFFSNVGMFDCCREKSCWRSRAVALNDGSDCDNSLCACPHNDKNGETVGSCMAAIEPAVVADAIFKFRQFRSKKQNIT